MNSYYFTFGQNHTLKDGFPMKDYYVEVKANSFFRARDVFMAEFAVEHLPAADKWAFQYDDADFKSMYFPKGRYLLIADIHDYEKMYWAYLHTNGELKLKAYYDETGIIEAQGSPFVVETYGPFKANGAEEAFEKLETITAQKTS